MIRINLAPPGPRNRRARLGFLSVIGLYIGVLSGLGSCHAAAIREERRLSQEIAVLDRDAAAVRAGMRRDDSSRVALGDLGRRIETIEELTRGQSAVLRALDALIDGIPAELWLTGLEGRGAELRASGSAQSARAVGDFAANLRAVSGFTDVEIVASRQDFDKSPPGPVTFEITCRFGVR